MAHLPGSQLLGSLQGQRRSLPADACIVFSKPQALLILAVPQAGGAASSAVPGKVGSTGGMLAGMAPEGPLGAMPTAAGEQAVLSRECSSSL